jgi:repressor LexA
MVIVTMSKTASDSPLKASPAKLTPRQAEVLEFIKSYLDETGYPPTRADIARQLGFKSANASEEHLKALARKGAIEMIPGTSRGIKLPETLGIPIVGRVAAGNPILAQEHIEDYCELPPSFFRPKADYLLTVQGDSMIDIGILDGDLLAVHSTTNVNNGDIVVARVEDEVTVKRLQKNRSKHLITLLPENADFSPIDVDLREQNFVIEGIMVGVIRH